MQCAQLVDGIKYTDASLIFTGKMSKIKKGLRESFSRDVSIYYYAIFSIVFLETNHSYKICEVDEFKLGIFESICLVKHLCGSYMKHLLAYIRKV